MLNVKVMSVKLDLNNRLNLSIDSEFALLAIYTGLLFIRLIITVGHSLCEEILQWSCLSATCI